MTIERVIELILGQAGVLVLLIIIIFGGFKGWYVFGWYAKELRDRNERLETRLDRAVGAGERIAGTAERATRLAEVARSETSGA